MSLVGSIFGGSEKKASGDASYRYLFDESLKLPERPQHEAATLSKKKRKEEMPEETSRKKRKAKKEVTTVEEEQPKTEAEQEGADERTIFVGNLPLDTTRQSLASMFKACGKVESARLRSVAAAGVKLPTDRAGDQVRTLHLGLY